MGRTTATNRILLRPFNTSGLFNGSDNYVSKSSETAFNLPAYTIELWVKGGKKNNDFKIYGEGGTGSNTPHFYISARNTGGVSIIARNDANTTVLNANSTNKTILDGTWHQLVFSDANGTANLYVDTVADATSYAYTKSGVYTLNRTAIGALLKTSAANFYTGLLDQLRVWNVALNQTQVNSLYFNNIKPSGLILEWLLDDATGSAVADTSGSGTNGLWNGTLGSQWSTDSFITARTVSPTRTVVT